MYLSNKYTTCYYQIIERAKNRILHSSYFERHHIIPKSMGGSDKPDNIVKLTAKEHFICHRLLTKMTEGENLIKMKRAVWRMTVRSRDFQKRYTPSARTYEFLRLEFGSLRLGISTPDSVKKKISEANRGKPAWNKGIARTSEEKQKISAARLRGSKNKDVWNKGGKHSEETKLKISYRAKMREKTSCIYCGNYFDPANYLRWHGEKCKSKTL